MPQVIETGKPILVDLLTNKAGTFLVSRCRCATSAAQVIGAVGMVLIDHPETTMQPLITKFARLQRELDDAQRAARGAAAPQVHHRQLHRRQPAGARGQAPGAPRGRHRHRPCCCSAKPAPARSCSRTPSTRRRRAPAQPFVGVNIAAVPETLLEAEFFGVAPGAYTGADRKGRDGKFKLADGGTLFLDEIGDMPLALQAKLLRVLQEQEVEPLGSNTGAARSTCA